MSDLSGVPSRGPCGHCRRQGRKVGDNCERICVLMLSRYNFPAESVVVHLGETGSRETTKKSGCRPQFLIPIFI